MIPLSLGYSEGRSKNVNAGQAINVYPCANPEDSKAPLTLSECPGLKQFSQPVTGYAVRALHRAVNGVLYALVGTGFYSVNLTTGTATLLGSITGVATGAAWILSNANYQIMVAANDGGWVYNWSTGTFAAISDADFPGAASLAFMDQYGVVVEPDTGRLYNSALNDFTSWDATAFVTAEAAPDNLIAIIADHQEIIAFGEYTIEIYQNSGDADAVFQRLPGAIIEIGINAAASPAKKTNSVFWLDDSLQVRMMQGYSPQIISTPAITYQIQQLSRTDDAVGMTFIWNGHAFYGLTFPTGNRTFFYDITASAQFGRAIWHERRSYPLTGINRWRGNAVFQYGADVYVGDHSNGWIYKLDEEIHQDNGEPMQRIWTTAEVYDRDRRRTIFHEELEVEVEMGVGTTSVEDPQIVMQYSDDNGRTWSAELWESIGKIGEFINQARWFCLGSSRSRIYRFMVVDNVKLEVVGVYLRASMGRH